MKNALLLIISFLIFMPASYTQENDSLFLKAAITKLLHAREYTLKVAGLMPEEKYSFKPVKGEMSFGEQLLHLCANMRWLCSSYLNGQTNIVSDSTTNSHQKAQVMQALEKNYEYAIWSLTHFDASHLADTVSFFAGPMNKLQIINLLNDHQTHHRAQILVYLRLNGIKPPDYIGW